MPKSFIKIPENLITMHRILLPFHLSHLIKMTSPNGEVIKELCCEKVLE